MSLSRDRGALRSVAPVSADQNVPPTVRVRLPVARRRLLERNPSGAALVEYGLLLTLIAAVAIAALVFLGPVIGSTLSDGDSTGADGTRCEVTSPDRGRSDDRLSSEGGRFQPRSARPTPRGNAGRGPRLGTALCSNGAGD